MSPMRGCTGLRLHASHVACMHSYKVIYPFDHPRFLAVSKLSSPRLASRRLCSLHPGVPPSQCSSLGGSHRSFPGTYVMFTTLYPALVFSLTRSVLDSSPPAYSLTASFLGFCSLGFLRFLSSAPMMLSCPSVLGVCLMRVSVG